MCFAALPACTVQIYAVTRVWSNIAPKVMPHILAKVLSVDDSVCRRRNHCINSVCKRCNHYIDSVCKRCNHHIDNITINETVVFVCKLREHLKGVKLIVKEPG